MNFETFPAPSARHCNAHALRHLSVGKDTLNHVGSAVLFISAPGRSRRSRRRPSTSPLAEAAGKRPRPHRSMSPSASGNLKARNSACGTHHALHDHRSSLGTHSSAVGSQWWVSSKCFQSGRLGLLSPFCCDAFQGLSWTTSARAVITHSRALYREFHLLIASIGCLLRSKKLPYLSSDQERRKVKYFTVSQHLRQGRGRSHEGTVWRDRRRTEFRDHVLSITITEPHQCGRILPGGVFRMT
jgi:hypothetical protein